MQHAAVESACGDASGMRRRERHAATEAACGDASGMRRRERHAATEAAWASASPGPIRWSRRMSFA
eukprot:6205167-Pleurochrysis_carterae.AAC.1